MSKTDSTLLPAAVAAVIPSRLARLREVLAAERLDGLLISHPTEIRYLTGFVGDDSLLVVDHETASIITDPRFDEYLDPWRDIDAVEVVMGVRHRLEETVRARGAERGTARLGIQGERLTVAGRRRLADAIGADRLADTFDLVPRLRMLKDEVEIAAIEHAVAIQEDALPAALDGLREGMTEHEFCALLEYEMKTRGASGPSFPPIIGAGANSSVIHHTVGATPIGPGVLLVDWGAIVDGYCADMTRTFGLGSMPDPIREAYEIVLEAQTAAIEACRPGRTCAEIDAVAREVITARGFGERFAHGLGHGLGLEIHEAPYFNDLETEVFLEPGMVMTVEPGIYLPSVGGVRIEDDILITDDGARVLTSLPRDLESALLEPVGGSRTKVGTR